jgi:hypothetical protein
MGGILITPVEKDFERLAGADVESIYAEVSLEGKAVEHVMNAMISSLDVNHSLNR